MFTVLSDKFLLKLAIIAILSMVIFTVVFPVSSNAVTEPGEYFFIDYDTVLLDWSINASSDYAVYAAAQAHSIPFDNGMHVSHIITLEDGRYYVVRYSNYLPLAGGVEVFNETGAKIADRNKAESVLKAVAWTASVRSLNDSDIASLAIILNDSRNLASAAVPVSSLSNNLIDTFNLRRSMNQFGITNELIVSLALGVAGETNVQYEAAVMIVNNLNDQLGDFSNATVTVNGRLPGIISKSAAIRNGTAYADEDYRSDVIETAAGLGVMEGKIASVQNALNGISGISEWLAMIEKLAADLLAYIPVYGNTLQDYANYLLSVIDDYQDKVFDVKGYAKNLQDSIGAEKDQLDALVSRSDQRADDLIGSWNTRQTARLKVILYVALLIIITAVIVTLILIVFRRQIKASLSSIFRKGR